jgi:hypothetical protein
MVSREKRTFSGNNGNADTAEFRGESLTATGS